MGKDDNYYGQVRITTVAAELLPELMDEGKNFIAFTKSRKNVEIVLKETRDHLEAEGFLGTHKPNEDLPVIVAVTRRLSGNRLKIR